MSEVHRLSSPCKLVSRGFWPEGTIVKFVNGVTSGGDEVVVMAGPCSIESREQILSVAEAVYTAGARFLCGGAFNLRSSPYSFQGMGEEGLQLMREAACRFGLLVVCEVMEISQTPQAVSEYDWVGNASTFSCIQSSLTATASCTSLMTTPVLDVIERLYFPL